MKILWHMEYEETFEYVECKAMLEFLPMELLVQILSFLNPSDLMCAGLSFKRFAEALQHKKFSNNWILNFSEPYSTQFAIPIQLLMQCERQFPAIMLQTPQVDDIVWEDFWIENGENLRELHFLSGLLTKEEFVNVVKYAKNLETLKIEANNMFKNWVINKFSYERKVTFPKCSHISLARNNIISKDIFEYMMKTSPNIKAVDLSNCLQLMSPQERNSFLDSLLEFLKSSGKNITCLDLSNTVTDDLFLDKLGQIKDIKLKELHLTFMGSTKNSNYGLPVLIKNQPTLENFDLTASPSVNDIVVRLISIYMTNIKILLLKKCHNLTDHGVREISKLVHLKSLEISDCDHVTDTGIMDGVLMENKNPHLRNLNLGLLQNLTEVVVRRLSYVLESLSHLDLGGVSVGVTDNSLQMILRHMQLLRLLNVDSCCKVYFGFTGVSSEYARRHHSIRNLKGLQILKCNGLYKLTDYTMIDALSLLELKEAHFARCNFTLEGVKAFVNNCPSLEVLDFSEGKFIDDKCVDIITLSLPRLKTLKLNRCEKISEKVFKILHNNCHQLR
ncbi:CLUMA_CG013329, isoform A, partial [Clunio marinus]